MGFVDAPEHAAFRREFRAWLDADLTCDLKVEDIGAPVLGRPEG